MLVLMSLKCQTRVQVAPKQSRNRFKRRLTVPRGPFNATPSESSAPERPIRT